VLFTPEALTLLTEYSWPGNVRELANAIEHAMILCDEGPIRPEHLPAHLAGRRLARPTLRTVAGGQSLREMEMQAIYEALQRHDGNKPKAADELGISLKTLYNKINLATTSAKSA
jgi:two-component system NtrC family response regulator